MNSLWELPACFYFLDMIVNSSIDGNIVVTFIPEHAPDGFKRNLKKHFENKDIFGFETIHFRDCIKSSNSFVFDRFLHKYFELDRNIEYVDARIEKILLTEGCKKTGVFYIDEINYDLLNDFREFIVRLRQVVLSYPSYNRPRFIFNLDPKNFFQNDIPNDTNIKILKFYGILDNSDLLIAFKYFFNLRTDDKEALLEYSTVTSLATFDLDYAIFLSEDNIFKTFTDFKNRSNIYLTEKKWADFEFISITDLNERDVWKLWSNGIIDYFSGKRVYHTAFLFHHGKEPELLSRLWRGQADFILPIVEEVRMMILTMEKIVFPSVLFNEKEQEKFNSKYDLEIGEIKFNFDKYNVVKFNGLDYNEQKKLKKLVSSCYRARTELSHQKILPRSFCSELFNNYFDVINLFQMNSEI